MSGALRKAVLYQQLDLKSVASLYAPEANLFIATLAIAAPPAC